MQEPHNEAPRTMSDTETATVLVVDDDEGLAELYKTFLASAYTVSTTTSGGEALEQVDATVDIVLLDRRMPGMTGDEVLAELRDRGLDCQVAMLTAVEPDADIVDMPFDDYKTKPVDQNDLVGLVEVLLKRSTYDEQSQQYFSLASKKAALEAAGNDQTDEYHALVEQMDDLREELETTLDEIGAEGAFAELLAD
jgi:DNA-binding response OmpR family regulator